eukprot:68347-Prorocentrum_minimum.AAC.3
MFGEGANAQGLKQAPRTLGAAKGWKGPLASHLKLLRLLAARQSSQWSESQLQPPAPGPGKLAAAEFSF